MRLVAVAFAFFVVVPTAAGKTFKVNWSEAKHVHGGEVDFHVTRIVIGSARWSVTAAVTNRSRYTLAVSQPQATGPNGTVWSRNAGFGIAYRDQNPECVPSKGCVPGLFAFPATRGLPALPQTLGPRRRWSGTFSGAGNPPRTSPLWLTFGWFEISKAPRDAADDVGIGFNWVTDHTVRL